LLSGSLSQRWTWSFGEEVPTGSAPNQINSLPGKLVEIPDELRCPISHTLMQDAVTAAGGFTYSREAVSSLPYGCAIENSPGISAVIKHPLTLTTPDLSLVHYPDLFADAWPGVERYHARRESRDLRRCGQVD